MTINNTAKYCLYALGVLVFLYVIQQEDGGFIGGFLEGFMPMYGHFAMIGFPVMYVIWRDTQKENKKLQQRVDDHVHRWEIISKKEESNTREE